MTHLERGGIVDLFPTTSTESQADFVERVRKAKRRINLFGLTRNYYARSTVLPVLAEAADRVPVRVYVMDPHCDSRRDRYRIEPAEAAMENADRYIREILRPLAEVAAAARDMRIYTFNFPVSFSIEEIDTACRVMLYGHGKRGTEGPIIVVGHGSLYDYFESQIRWIEMLADADTAPEPWRSKGLAVEPLGPTD